MLGWMDAEAMRRTLTHRPVTFWSRSRQEYWRKGDTSGNVQFVRKPLSTATRTPCSSGWTRSASPATRARDPASTSAPSLAFYRMGFRHDRQHQPGPIRPAAADHRVVPVIRELFADGETPVGIYRKLADGRPGTFLLESAEQGGIWSRYSFIGVVLVRRPDPERGCRRLARLRPAAPTAHSAPTSPRAPLEALAQLYERWRTPRDPRAPAAHRRTGGLHRLGGDPADRTPAEPSTGGLLGARAGAQFRLGTRCCRPPHRHRSAHRRGAGLSSDGLDRRPSFLLRAGHRGRLRRQLPGKRRDGDGRSERDRAQLFLRATPHLREHPDPGDDPHGGCGTAEAPHVRLFHARGTALRRQAARGQAGIG